MRGKRYNSFVTVVWVCSIFTVSLAFFFSKFASLVWAFFFVFIFIRIFTCLLCTYNISLYCIHKKGELPLFLFLFFHQVSRFGLSLFFAFYFIFLRIFTCLLYICNISLYGIHTKSDKNYIHLQKEYDKYCTNFANVYNICQFLCVYNQ